ncbi:MAG: ABC transporter permease [Bacteroidales bacterium]|nr:ABC transporter permease [Bacteroidales bacterium]MCF8455237.1 ABC transporter permease [Bacteroidales bacterium]
MNRFFAFVKKEFLHIFRDYRTMIILFGMPIAQLLIFGFVISNEIRDAHIAILDHSKDEHTQKITEKLVSSGYFILSDELKNENEIDACFRAGNAKLALVFEPGFGRLLEKTGKANLQIIADASDPNSAEMLSNYTQAIISAYIKDLNMAGYGNKIIRAETRMQFNPGLKGVFMFVPGTMALILMLISAMMTSITIAREKETGTMEVLLISPLRPIQIILGKVAPYLLLSFINAIVILALGFFVFGLPIRGSLILLLAESMLFILMALSLGILISTVAKSQQVAMFISMFALLLPTMLLSGFIFPIENMPVILQYLSAIMPPRWFIVIIKNIMLKGTGFLFVWKETLILTLMAIAFVVVSVKKFKLRLE